MSMRNKHNMKVLFISLIDKFVQETQKCSNIEFLSFLSFLFFSFQIDSYVTHMNEYRSKNWIREKLIILTFHNTPNPS